MALRSIDLMIGDWVTFAEGDTIKIKVAGLFGDSVFGQIDGAEELEELDLNDLAGIPITKEILEKNGFRHYGEMLYLPSKEQTGPGKSVSVSHNMYKTSLRVKNGQALFEIIVPCSYRASVENRGIYVHQLQQALRLCGIDKDIELP